ncbi:MAG: Tox-REase-5 domain-containing protein [Acidobacteria bacterium]|nr:Tox-REase-5 domain-containing protein [Acidobacteriota bacterium]
METAVGRSNGIRSVSRHDFLPFGEEWNPPGNAKEKKLFTGHERDADTGLDYFGARYYRPQVGRFTTIDPLQTTAENLVDPQRWNRYAYVTNNPLKYTDPDGKNPLLIMGGIGAAVYGGWAIYQNVSHGQPWYNNVGVEASKGLLFGVTLGLAAPAVAGMGAADVAGAALGSGGTWVASTEAMSARPAAFQAQVTGRAGEVFLLNGVKFDGMLNNVLQEAKGPGYAAFVKDGAFLSWFNGAADLVAQAQRQLAAAGGTPVQWTFAEAAAAEATRALFKANGIKGIQIIVGAQ